MRFNKVFAQAPDQVKGAFPKSSQEQTVGYRNKTSQATALLVTPLLMVLAPLAWGESGHTTHKDQQMVNEKAHGEKVMDHQSTGGHAHSHWVTPPVHYAGKRGQHWFDKQTIARGEKLYQDNCVTCHGKDGRGTGVEAASLEHPPADLTYHFHPKPGKNDDYLFWRVSEGGTVEPFAAMKSAMPAFKLTMSEAERWSVLAYVHHKFHKETKNVCIGSQGILQAINQEKRVVNISHEEIPALGWPPMRMDFSVQYAVNLKSLKIGQKIEFCLGKSGESGYSIMAISPAL